MNHHLYVLNCGLMIMGNYYCNYAYTTKMTNHYQEITTTAFSPFFIVTVSFFIQCVSKC